MIYTVDARAFARVKNGERLCVNNVYRQHTVGEQLLIIYRGLFILERGRSRKWCIYRYVMERQ